MFSSWTLFARTEDLHVGALIGPEPPGLPPCEKLAYATALRTLPRAEGTRALHLCPLAAQGPAAGRPPLLCPNATGTKDAPSSTAGRAPTHATGARQGLSRRTKAGSGQPADRNGAGEGASLHTAPALSLGPTGYSGHS